MSALKYRFAFFSHGACSQEAGVVGEASRDALAGRARTARQLALAFGPDFVRCLCHDSGSDYGLEDASAHSPLRMRQSRDSGRGAYVRSRRIHNGVAPGDGRVRDEDYLMGGMHLQRHNPGPGIARAPLRFSWRARGGSSCFSPVGFCCRAIVAGRHRLMAGGQIETVCRASVAARSILRRRHALESDGVSHEPPRVE